MKSPHKRFGVMVLTAIALFCSFEGTAQKADNSRLSTNSNAGTDRLVQANSNSAADYANPTASDNVSPFDAVKGKKEDTRKRDAFSKHYINEDGSFTALIGSGPIHYEKNGQFLDIDHKISASSDFNYPFANTSNLFESYFGATSHSGVKNKTAEGEIKEFLNTKMYWEVNGQATNLVNSGNTAITVQGDKAYYPNLYGNISAEFTMLTGKRKLNYIIPNHQALGNIPAGADYLVFTEDVILPFGWTSQVSEQGVSILNPLGQTIYLYENPVSTDASNELTQEENTIFETIQLGNTLTIKTKVKTEWLLNSERQFPVMVDPTVSALANGGLSVASDGFTETLGYLGYINSYFTRYFIKFNTSSIPSGSTVTATTGFFYIFGWSGTYNTLNSCVWASSLDPTTNSGTSLYNSATGNTISGNMTGLSNVAQWKSSAFTPTGINYVQTSNNNNGFVAAAVSPNGSWNNNRFLGANTHLSASNKPYLSITYTAPAGPPSCATVYAPANGIDNVASGQSLSWSSVSGATSYDVYFGTSSNPPLLGNTTGIFYNPGCLEPNTTYYWRIAPKNANGTNTSCTVWSFTTSDRIGIYSQNFDGFISEGMLSEVTPQDGWLASTTAAQSGVLRNVWSTHSHTTRAVEKISMGISAYNGNAPDAGGGQLNYYGNLFTERWVYRTTSTTGLKDVKLSFRYKVVGKWSGATALDYGKVIYNPTGAGPTSLDNWYEDSNQGGNNSDNLFYNQPTAKLENILLPTDADNNPNLMIGYYWANTSTGSGSSPTFVVDDIVVSGCPTGGSIAPLNTVSNGATSVNLTVSDTHSCAKYQWEQSASPSGPWVNVTGGTGATTTSYTTGTISETTYFRAKVYYGSCEPSYQPIAEVKIVSDAVLSFHNFGGDNQLAFNNSRIADDSPEFRLSHSNSAASTYQIEINTAPDFSGTPWVQDFNGTFPVNVQTNFVVTNTSGNLTSDQTYYVRARIKDASNLWSDWTTETYSFTYQTPKDIPDWFQTTQAQFQSDELVGVGANASGDVVKLPNENAIVNGSFTDTSGWTTWKTSGTGGLIEVSSTDCSNCPVGTNRNLKMYLWLNSVQNGDMMIVSQQIDLTNVDEITYNANSYYGPNSSNPGAAISNLRFIIGGTSSNEVGTVMHTTNQAYCPTFCTNSVSDQNITINTSGYTGVQTVKFVVEFTQTHTTAGLLSFYVNNVVATSSPQGTITSTPIHLASVQGATAYEGITWNQTLGGGDMTLKVQQSADGISGWTDVVGFDNISETVDGEKTFDLSGMTPYPHIRLVGSLDGEDVVLHDWSVQFQTEELDCSIETIWNGTSWSNSVPDGSTFKIIFEGNYNSSTDSNYPATTGLMGCSVEVRGDADVVIASGHSITIDNEITVDNANGATFTVKSDANLVQVNAGVENDGNIIVERIANVPSNQYNYWASPVEGQLLYSLYDGAIVPANRVMTYNTWNDYFTIVSNSPPARSQFGKGYSIKGPASNAPDNTDENATIAVTAKFIGKPNNESLLPEQNEITLSPAVPNANPALEIQGFNLIGNPYPSNLDIQKLYQENEDQFFYDIDDEDTPSYLFWDNTNNTQMTQQGSGYNQSNYALYNPNFDDGTAAPRFLTGGEDEGYANAKKPNGIVKPGQGFIMRASATASKLVLNNEMRTTAIRHLGDTEDAVYYKNGNNGAVDDIYGARPRNDKFWIELVNPNEMHIQTAVGYFKNAENTFEKFDSKILNEGVSDNIYSLSQDAVKLALQGRQSPFENTDVIPLGVKFFVTGQYKIQLEDTKGIFKNHQNIYLKDKHLNIIHNLSESFYEFEGRAGVFEDRFEIVFKDESQTSDPVLTTASDNYLKIIKKDRQIEITSSRDKILEVEIFNLSGWSIYKNEKVNSKTLNVPASLFGKQIIVVKVLTETGEIETKKIINK